MRTLYGQPQIDATAAGQCPWLGVAALRLSGVVPTPAAAPMAAPAPRFAGRTAAASAVPTAQAIADGQYGYGYGNRKDSGDSSDNLGPIAPGKEYART